MTQRYIGVAVALFLIVAGWEDGEGASRTVRQGTDGFTVRIEIPPARESTVALPEGSFLELDIPDFFPPGSEAEGLPGLPARGFPFSIPPGMTARVTGVRVLSRESKQGPPPLPVPHRSMREVGEWSVEDAEYRPDPRVYRPGGRYPEETVTLGPVMGWRFHRVQSLVVTPVSVSPAEGSYEFIRELEIDVAFVPEARPRERQAAREVPVLEDAPGWDLFFDGSLLNASSARAFRRRPELSPTDLPVEPGQTLVRVRVGESGPCRLSYEDLSAAGFPAGIPVGEVRVEERGYTTGVPDPYTVTNLPRRVEDDGDGVFGPGDFVLFFGQNVQDRFDPPPHEARYGYFHTYWVTHSSAGGKEYEIVDGYPAGSYALQDRFRDLFKVEEDAFYVNNPQDTGSLFYPTHLGLYWLDSQDVDVRVLGGSYISNRTGTGGNVWFPMDTPFVLDNVKAGGTLRITAEWHGRNTVTSTANHFVSMELNGTRVLDDSLFTLLSNLKWVSGTLGIDSLLHDGDNEMRILGHSSLASLTGAAFDYFELSYDRGLRAAGDLLVVTTAPGLGPVEYPLTGFTSPDILVLDLTDPANPRSLTGTATGGPGDYGVSVRLTVTGTARKLAAFVPASFQGLPDSPHALPPDLGTAPLSTGLSRDLIAAGEGSDYILITHPSFRDSWQPLIDLREDEGHHVFLCDVWEIYDQFAGGDKTPWAIQRFLLQAFQTWDPAPSYVLLGGDANEDYRMDTPESDPDWVPTMMHTANVPGSAGRELAGTDNWFVAALAPGQHPLLDVLPEMHVGRLPVGSPAEVQTMVQKLVAYANMSDQDDWRHRGVFLADDQYSTTLNFTSGYCWRAQELVFRATTKAVCDSIRLVAKLAAFECDTLFLNAHLDTVDALLRVPGNPNNCPSSGGITLLGETSRYARDKVTPLLLNKLNQGCFVWEFTGHANKALITTEQIIQSRRGLSPDDVTRVNNLGKPFVFYGYACHLAEFEDAKVNNRAGGDAIGEALLLAPNRGAIATIASTGYEWLHFNPHAQLWTSRYLFWDLPRDPDTGRPRRILGEVHSWSFGNLVASSPGSQDFIGMIRTYVYLGDPALKVDIQSASFLVDVDGTPWTDGTGLVAGSPADSLSFRVRVSDDVDVSTIVVRDGGTELPPGRVTITPPGARDRGLQSYEAAFRTTLRLDNYDLVVEAQDWLDRSSRVTFPVRFDVAYTSDGQNLPPNGGVDPQADVQVDLLSPVGLVASDLELLVDGANRGEAFASVADTTGRRWGATARGPWGEGAHTLQVRAPGTGTVLSQLGFAVATDKLTVYRTYAYPNPYEEGNPGPENPLYFVYELSRRGDRAEVQIFTVKGRRVLRRELSAFTNRNAFRWDLRDEAGDLVANGVYLFRLIVYGEDGTRLDRLERVAVAR